MPAYVALLRGIAPTNPKMRNAELVKVFESLGHDRVRAVISSGNVLFESPGRSRAKLESSIEPALLDHLGAPCSTIVRSRAQIDSLLDLDVFDADDDGPTARCNVTFLKDRDAGEDDLPKAGPGWEVLAIRDQAVFSVIDTSAAKTPALMADLEKTYGKRITTRTWKTVHRIRTAFAR